MTPELVLGKVGVAGRWLSLTAIRPDGRRRLLSGGFKNLITNAGLNNMGTSGNSLNACVVGTGNTAPAVGDTALVTQVGQSSSVPETTSGRQASAPFFGWHRRVFRFNAGVAEGNLAEIGILSAGEANIFSRALILDSGGSPTTVTVLADEILDASYELRIYPPLVDVVDTIMLDGVSRDTVLRANQVTAQAAWSSFIKDEAGALGPGQETNAGQVSNGALNDIETAPDGTVVQFPLTDVAYVNDSLERAFTMSLGTAVGNLAGGITVYRFNTTLGSYKVSFDPALDKTDQKTLTLTAKIAWARR